MATEKLAELLFNSSDKMPEGLYLQLINLSKDIYNESSNQMKPRFLAPAPTSNNWLYFSEYFDNVFSLPPEGQYFHGNTFEVFSPKRDVRLFYTITRLHDKSWTCKPIEISIHNHYVEQGQYYMYHTQYKCLPVKRMNWDAIKNLIVPSDDIFTSQQRHNEFEYLMDIGRNYDTYVYILANNLDYILPTTIELSQEDVGKHFPNFRDFVT